MNKILIIAMLALVASFSQANATVVTAPAIAAAGSVVISSPAASQVTIIRGVVFCNDTAVAACAHMYTGGNLLAAKHLGMVCAAAYSCSNTPALNQPNPAAPTNGLAGFFGEQFQITGQLTVACSTPSAAAIGGMTFTVDYIKPVK